MVKIKKLFGILFVSLSIAAYSGELEDRIEANLMKTYPTLTVGTVSLPVTDYDVDIKKDRLKVEIEVKEKDAAAIFDKMDKAKLESILSEIAGMVKKESSRTENVNLKIEFEHDILPDKTLYKNTF